jgi:hypothetical protein
MCYQNELFEHHAAGVMEYWSDGVKNANTPVLQYSANKLFACN